jgi:hypothetical protein
MSLGFQNSIVGLVRSSELEQFRINKNNKENSSMKKAIEMKQIGIKSFWFGNYQFRLRYWTMKEWHLLGLRTKYWYYQNKKVLCNNKPVTRVREICLLGFTIGYLKY